MYFNRQGQQEDSLYHDTLDMIRVTDTSQYPLTEFTRHANKWYKRADNWIWESDYVWKFDDKQNTSDLPICTGTLVDGQQDYAIPSAARRIDGIAVYDSDGNYHKLKVFDESQLNIDPSEFYEEDGMPKYYDVSANSIFLYPAPSADSVTLSKGLKIYLKRKITEFGITDTATEPGFDSNFHNILSLGCAYDYCISRVTDELSAAKAKPSIPYESIVQS